MLCTLLLLGGKSHQEAIVSLSSHTVYPNVDDGIGVDDFEQSAVCC